ncbi:hypothetical protein [Dechloromonas denitrificans]|uniref:hypothetical protein n=1 Tax=Dechloromonas denitrificans TaxID=281362 RepID=UPI001CFB7DD0|nr:hypothetical protein [Dechloromonas denitrificans]UCV09413.1 hypothetical protein KI615_07825 [Dechloromonas denitrificans]
MKKIFLPYVFYRSVPKLSPSSILVQKHLSFLNIAFEELIRPKPIGAIPHWKRPVCSSTFLDQQLREPLEEATLSNQIFRRLVTSQQAIQRLLGCGSFLPNDRLHKNYYTAAIRHMAQIWPRYWQSA